MKKRIISTIISCILSLSILASFNSSVSVWGLDYDETKAFKESDCYDIPGYDKKMEAEMACSEILNMQFNRLVDYWGGEFPDYYAGAYILDKKLHLMFTEISDSLKETICSIIGNILSA